MAFAAINLSNELSGCFTEKEHGRPFEYKRNPEMVFHPPAYGGRVVSYPHLVFVGPQGDQVRMALIKKTVAYVVVDVNAQGRYVIEKWAIKNHRIYPREQFLQNNYNSVH
jgi:hypothetical protein